MKQLKYLLIAFTLFASCKKNGTGGSATITLNATHHGKKIPFTKVYIKYNEIEFPGEDVSVYNSSQTADINGIAIINGLRPGDYYIYGTGYDSTIAGAVKGGLSIKIRNSERKNEIKTELPMTE